MGRFNQIFLFCLVVCAAALPGRAFAEEPWQQWIDQAGFQQLAIDAARNVDLFREIWAVDPNARFYGGTSRDFLWFLRGELAKAKSPEQMARIVKELRARPIAIKEFVVGQSDVDVISEISLKGVKFETGYLDKIEGIDPLYFIPGNDRYEQEQKQGYVPVEKIQLGPAGFQKVPGLDSGDGVGEIFRGMPTVHFDARIVDTPLYKAHDNHEILLALRYLRQVAMAYFRRYGREYPDVDALWNLMDPESRAGVQRVFDRIQKNPAELAEFLKLEKFRRRVDKALGKAFRSYTNPTAAKLLLERFGVDKALALFPGQIKPFHTLMYGKYRNPVDEAAHRAQLGLGDAYVTSMEEYMAPRWQRPGRDRYGRIFFPLFHGTDNMDHYRSIVFQGNVASEGGAAGEGVYVADHRSRKFAENYRGEKTMLVELRVSPDAKVVDIRQGAGKAAFDEFRARFTKLKWQQAGTPLAAPARADVSAFADFIGADIVRYPYEKAYAAYVIKNGAVIQSQKGITYPLMTTAEAKQNLAARNYSVDYLEEILKFDPSLEGHLDYLLSDLPGPRIFQLRTFLAGYDMVKRSHIMADMYTHHPEYISAEEWELNFKSAGEYLTKAVIRYVKRGEAHSISTKLLDTFGALLSIPEAFRAPLPDGWLDGNFQNLKIAIALSLGRVVDWTPDTFRTLVAAASRTSLTGSTPWSTFARQKIPAGLYADLPRWRRALMAADLTRARRGSWKEEDEYARHILLHSGNSDRTAKLFDVTREEMEAAGGLLRAVEEHAILPAELAAAERVLGKLDSLQLQAFVDLGFKETCVRVLRDLGRKKGYAIGRTDPI